jgi:putative hydrolase of the HAD superfamily
MAGTKGRAFAGVRRIFFDSGMVLVHPRSGEWFYPEVHREYCEFRGLPEKTLRQNLNFRLAYAGLDRDHLIRTLDEEHAAFLRFYAILFRGVEGKDSPALAEACAKAVVHDRAKYAFYDDVEGAVRRLSVRYDLGIISDAWPSMRGVYEARGMDRYFRPFIISSEYGCTKGGLDLFRFALANVAEHPEDILFVDDSPGNCRRAMRLGMKAVVLNRNKYHGSSGGLPHVPDMSSLEEMLAD